MLSGHLQDIKLDLSSQVDLGRGWAPYPFAAWPPAATHLRLAGEEAFQPLKGWLFSLRSMQALPSTCSSKMGPRCFRQCPLRDKVPTLSKG